MPEAPPRKVVDILTSASEYLAANGVESAGLAAKLLLSRLLNCKPLELAFKFNDVLSERQLAAMRRGIKRVAAGEPVQYVIGETGFMGHTLKVDKRALIPRPETEILVETVLACAPLWQRDTPAIVDVGTGSGCIVLSLVKAKPEARYLAFDVSDDALALARENAGALDVADRVAFTKADIADALEPETCDALIANLPYIPAADVVALPREVRDHEPRTALDGGPTGLALIARAVDDATVVLKAGGYLFLEIGADQGAAVTALLREAGFRDITVKQDLNRRDRVVTGVLGE